MDSASMSVFFFCVLGFGIDFLVSVVGLAMYFYVCFYGFGIDVCVLFWDLA